MNKINKKDALEKLSELEKQTNELRKIIDAPEKIIDRIKTYEDACEYLGREPNRFNSKTNAEHAEESFHMIDTITEALLEGKQLDWADSDQKKWFPYFNEYKSGSGFRFYDSDFGWANSLAYGGARLCVDSKEKADYLGTQFLSLWNKFLNPVK